MINLDRHRGLQERLSDRDELLARVVDTNADAFIVVAADGRLTFLNAAAERLLGIPREQITGRPSTDPGLTLLTLEGEHMPVAARPTTRVFQSGEAAYDLEALFERPDGKRIVLSATAGPLRAERES